MFSKEEKLVYEAEPTTDGFPTDTTPTKFRKLTRTSVLHFLEVYTSQLKVLLVMQAAILLFATVFEILYARWYMILSLSIYDISLFIGTFAVFKRYVQYMRLFIACEAISLIISLCTTILAYWYIVGYNHLCNTSDMSTVDICLPRIIFILVSCFNPIWFVLSLFGTIYSVKLVRYFLYLEAFVEYKNNSLLNHHSYHQQSNNYQLQNRNQENCSNDERRTDHEHDSKSLLSGSSCDIFHVFFTLLYLFF